MEDAVIKKTTDAINRIMKEGIATTNIDNLYKLSKIKHMAKEDENMNYAYGNSYGNNYGNYGNYGRGYGYGEGYGAYGNSYGNYGRNVGYNSYGRYDNYGARGYDMRYRGHDYLDRMYDDYGRYMENRQRYGANEETDKSYFYMIKALEDFIKVLYEEADNEEQKKQLRETLQRSMM